jgi:hypothetical protein
MDPYLEDPVYWRGAHNGFIAFMMEVLNATLPPAFAANIEERLYVVPSDRSIYADLTVRKRRAEIPDRAGVGTAPVADFADPPGVLSLDPVEMHEWFVEIQTVSDENRVVTIIEVLSHANKAAGSEGREIYLKKQREVLHSAVHLIEIDLLRSGVHTVAAPRDRLLEFGTWDYLVCLHRSTRRWDYEFWMNTIRQRLPRIRVPLTEGVPDVVLDLQAAFDRCYDAGPYRRSVDYRREPSPPLTGDDAAWADALLREKGLRP